MIKACLLAALVLASLARAEGVTAPQFDSLPGSAAVQETVYSQASLRVFEAGRPGVFLDGFDVFINGSLAGHSPLNLSSVLVDGRRVDLSVRKNGFEETWLSGVAIPKDGSLDVVALLDPPARRVSRPALALSLGLVAASLVAYGQPGGESAGLALLGSGLGLAALSQALARWVLTPSLRKKAQAHNARLGSSSP